MRACSSLSVRVIFSTSRRPYVASAFVAAGKLQIDDTTVAARQFIDLCLGDILKRLLFRVVETVEQDEIDVLVGQAVAMFMKVYGAPKGE
jgi:hypothetical protein